MTSKGRLSQREQAEVAAGGGEHGIDAVAFTAFEIVSSHPMVTLHLANHRLDGSSAWLKGELRADLPSEDDARALIREAMTKNGGYISQENGAGIVRETYPSFRKKRAMDLVKELSGNNKPGPKGPRKNRAQNRA